MERKGVWASWIQAGCGSNEILQILFHLWDVWIIDEKIFFDASILNVQQDGLAESGGVLIDGIALVLDGGVVVGQFANALAMGALLQVACQQQGDFFLLDLLFFQQTQIEVTALTTVAIAEWDDVIDVVFRFGYIHLVFLQHVVVESIKVVVHFLLATIEQSQ